MESLDIIYNQPFFRYIISFFTEFDNASSASYNSIMVDIEQQLTGRLDQLKKKTQHQLLLANAENRKVIDLQVVLKVKDLNSIVRFDHQRFQLPIILSHDL